MSDIRAMIRKILLEELERHAGKADCGSHVESVSISNDDDLNAFALRILDLKQTRDLKTDLQSGKIKFILERAEDGSNRPARRQKTVNSGLVVFQKNLVTEKDIFRLSEDTTRLSAGKNVYFTPLAKDEIRRRGLKIERNAQ